jgi:cytochrome P450
MWYTLDILLRALFHEAKDGIAPQVNHALGLVLKEAESRIWSIFSWPQRLILKLPKYRAAFAFLNDLATELVAGHKTRTDYPDDLLAKLIARYGSTTSGTGLLRDQIMTLLFAGHETSAVGLAWSLTMLAAHPVIYERMTSEIDRVLKGKSPTLEILKALPYTSQVFDEVLRLYPPVWTISRTALADDLIPTDDGVGVEIPQGTVTMLCIHALHRREAYWPNPEVFDPERFTSEAIASRHKFAWLPFGGGPRQCIGFRFATIESMIALTMINQKYRLSLVPGQTPQPYPSITLRPDGPLMFWIERRQPESISDTNATEAPLTPARCPFHTLAA